jgi:uncharacterized repeat protein (TIGR04138 family)
VDSRILEAVREDNRYAYEAYDFICQAVTYTQNRIARRTSDDPDDKHVTAAELLRGTVELAVKEFGMMAPIVFRYWGVRTTEDVGHLVFNLIRCERLSQSDRDELDDFVDVFDLGRALEDGFAMPRSTMANRRGVER